MVEYLLMDDNDLVRLLFEDDSKAFETLYRRYWKRLYALAYSKTKNPEVAKEMIQDVFADMWERRHHIQITRLEHYLFSAVKYQTIAFYKEKIFSQIEDIDIEDSSTDYQIGLNDFQQSLQHAIQQLPDKTREIFVLNRLNGKSAKEVAQTLQIPERTVEYHITQALRTLRIQLRDYFVSILWALCFMFLSK
ncbi:MAG: RNA polymerase sigma-70 factor [Spirosomataceae bacterium]